jgi:hypothetical protein
MCGGYWPAEQRLYLTNRAAFFDRLDRVVRAAEANHIGLIPSLFWHLPTVADLVNEPLQSLGDTNSRSIAYIRGYTTDIVSRYHSSPAIWGWEFGNEAALAADLPNAASQRPPVVPELGTPAQRSNLDELKSAQLLVAYREFGAIVHRLDPDRLILSGNALPRVSAWHNTHETNWVADTVEQFGEILRRDNWDPFMQFQFMFIPMTNCRRGRNPSRNYSIFLMLKQLQFPSLSSLVSLASAAGEPVRSMSRKSNLRNCSRPSNSPMFPYPRFGFSICRSRMGLEYHRGQ